MSPTLEYSYQEGVRGAERLAVTDREDATFRSIDWKAIHNAAQEGLRVGIDLVRRRWPHIRARQGMTLTHLPLFSYCAFEVPSAPHIDPVVVGIDFRQLEPGRVEIHADLAGEDSGKVWQELPSQQVPEEQEAIRAAAREMAGQLGAMADAIHDALSRQDPTACP